MCQGLGYNNVMLTIQYSTIVCPIKHTYTYAGLDKRWCCNVLLFIITCTCTCNHTIVIINTNVCVQLQVFISDCDVYNHVFYYYYYYRDVSGPQTLRILDIQTSKHHCEIRYLRRRESFAVTDLGSQNGTYINGERISEVTGKYVITNNV